MRIVFHLESLFVYVCSFVAESAMTSGVCCHPLVSDVVEGVGGQVEEV